jgi:hypothetical protein
VTFASAVAMATLNPFDILGADDNDDPAQLLAAAAVAKQKAEAKRSAAAPAGKGAQPAPAKLPTKPAPPAQAGEFGLGFHGHWIWGLGCMLAFLPFWGDDYRKFVFKSGFMISECLVV